MGAGNFFAGLLGGYTGTVVRNESRAYNQEMQARELDVNASLKALDEAVKIGDQGAMQAAAANFQRSVNAIREPFHAGLGGGKGKGKKQAQQDPLVSSILQGMIQHGAQQAGQPPMSEKIPAGPMAGQSAQSAGLAPVPTLASRNAPQGPTGSVPTPQAQSEAPQTGNRPATPQTAIPAPPSLASVLAKYPDLQAQAAGRGQEQAAESGARFKALKAQRETELGRPLKPEESDQLWESVSGVLPKNISTKPTLVTPKAPVTAGEAASSSPNAILADGRPLSALDPKQPVNLWQYPDGRVLAFPASPQSATSGTISGQEAKAVEETVGKPNPETGKPYTRVEALAKVRGNSKNPSLAQQEAQSWLAAHPGKTLADFLYWSKTVGSAPGVQLTPQAQDMMAQVYLQTGQMPSVGWGKSGVDAKIKVINRAGKMGQGTNVAENRAVYDSLKSSLVKTQTQARMLNAYENVANKNLDLLLDTSKKLVDTGSPWINIPVRKLAQQGSGSPDVTAFLTARQVAISEVSRVLNNMGSAGVLSDAARNEVSSLLSADSTMVQINAAAKILKQDMKNRHEGFPAEIKAIQSNIRNIGSVGTTGGAETATPLPKSESQSDPLGVY